MAKQRYVLVCGIVCRWEDKAPFVPSGKSVLGAIEYDKEADKLKCHECGEWYSSIAHHLVLKGLRHKISVREYKQRHGLRLGSSLLAPAARAKASRRRAAQHAVTKTNAGQFLPGVSHKPIRIARVHGDMEIRNLRGTCPVQSVARYVALAVELGRTPSVQDLKDHGSLEILHGGRNRIGDLQKQAGLEPNKPGFPPAYTKALLEDQLRNFYVLNQRIPTEADWSSNILPKRGAFRRTFGSMLAAYEQAGLSLVVQQQTAEMRKRMGMQLGKRNRSLLAA